ncbi:MAG: chromosome segregation protein [Rhodopirellula sp.]|nr:chromosome segregation protein [Rhodopirellula sp.]
MHCFEPHPTAPCVPALGILLVFLLRVVTPVHAIEPVNEPVAKVDFAQDVRSIISENCVFCHGPDESTRQADLRLDTQEGLESVIEKGSSTDSELIRRLTSADPDEVMPPPDSNRSLETEEIELVGRWINEGAEWQTHWSFRPLSLPEVPTVDSLQKDVSVFPLRNPIDHFVRQNLLDHNLTAAPEATRATLIRRLSLDLTGLPPTPQEVNQFLDDTSANAYEKLVDRLLDSDAYGQRMAWNWLDASRYADTNGYQGDRERTMWPWRDWVVDAFNKNLPYDQFTIWQIAGDLLPNATLEQKLATGFSRNHMINGEGGRIAEENRVEYVMDMSETVGTVWLGLTLNCCRCHDHKYDPISNREYYKFFGFFNQTPVNGGGGDPQTAPNLAVPTAQQSQKLDAFADQIRQTEGEITALSAQIASKRGAWEAHELAKLKTEPSWHTAKPTQAKATGSTLSMLPDQSILTSGPAPDKDTYTIVADSPIKAITALRIDALRHESFPRNSLSYSDSGNFVLTEIEIQIFNRNPDSDPSTPQKIATAEATYEQGSHGVANSFDGNSTTGWAVYEGRHVDRDHAAIFRFQKPLVIEKDQQLQVTLRHDSVHKKHNLGRFLLSVTGVPDPQLDDSSKALVLALETAVETRSAEQKQLVIGRHQASTPAYKNLTDKKAALIKERDALNRSLPKVMVMADMPKPRKTFMLNRGLYNKPTDEVESGLPDFLPRPAHQDSNQPANRLTLARWLVDSNNPLTARVTVNRFWQQIFGIGLVKTTEDFGTQGEVPLQMDLLNWLARTFQQNGWNVKQLIRTIVTSHTYRQSSVIRDQATYQRDPDNRLLARASRHRLPAWMLRDQALAASGLLSPVDGGPSVNTYQPQGVWEEASFGKKKYSQDSGEKLYRRSLYTYWRRIIAPTMFFDNASRQTCTVKTSRTNTPLHALQTLNNTAYVEAARVLAQKTLLEHPADNAARQTKLEEIDSARIDTVMKHILARPASPPEQTILLRGLNRTRVQFAEGTKDALALLAVGASQHNESISPNELAAWTNLCLAILNLDEALNRE